MSLEQISEGQEFNENDIKRFNEVDGYTLMFIRHGQYGKTFDEQKAFRIFHDAMVWRKQNQTYGEYLFHFNKDRCLFSKLNNYYFRYFTLKISSKLY